MKSPLEFLMLLALAGKIAAHPNPGPITTGPTSCGGNPCSDAVAAVPTCAVPCLDDAASVVSCATTDFSCLCSASDAVVDAAQNCVIGNCGIPRAVAVASSVKAVCSCITENPTTPCPQATPSVTSPHTPSSIPASSVPPTSIPPSSTTPSSVPTGGGGAKESDSSSSGSSTTSEPNNPTTISGTVPTLTFPQMTGSGSDSGPSPTSTSGGDGGPLRGGLSPGGGALAGDRGSGSDGGSGSGGDSDSDSDSGSGNSGSGNGSGSESESESGAGSESGGSSVTGTGTGTGSGTGAGAGAGDGGTEVNQTIPTGPIAAPTMITAGASGRSEFGVVASIVGAVLCAALAL